MAFYVPHPQQSAAKAKIDGFQPSGQQHQPPSPTNTFDPSSLFFSGPVFPDPFRNPHAGSGSMDFTETLLSMMPNNGGDQNQQHNQANGQQQLQQQQAQNLQQQQQNQQQQSQAGQPGAPLNLNIPQNIFDMSHFASPLSAFQQPSQQQQQQQQRNTPKTESVDSPAAVHTGHGFFDNSGTQPQQSHNPFASSIPPYLNAAGGHRPDSPTVANSIGSPSESGTAGPTSPFPTHASHARIHGHRSPSIGPTSHSRSRSRGATSRPPPAARNGMVKTGGPKRQSISSTPEEPSTSLPPPSARPQAILIPSHPSHPAQQQQQQGQQQQPQQHHHHAHHLSHEFTPHQLNALGPHPISPLGIHSTQTAPSGWFVPSNGQAANGQGTVEPATFGLQEGIQQSFGQAFQPRSLSLGPNPKPGTSASASVLAGSLGTVPVGGVPQANKSQQEMAMDAAAKQYVTTSRAAILNEKRRRRRESHNAVERRRRDNINEKISELSTLLPESMLDPTGTNAGGSGGMPTTAEGLLPTGGAAALEDAEKETPAMKANKGIILRKSVEYIRYLQQLVRVQANRNRELEAELQQYRGGQSTSMDISTSNGSVLDPHGTPSAHANDPNSMNTFGILDSLAGIDEDSMSMSFAPYSPEDTTAFSAGGRLSKLPEDSSVKDGSPRSAEGASEEEEERGRGVQRGRRGYNGNPSVSVGHGKQTLGVRDDSAELESAVSDGESRERMMD